MELTRGGNVVLDSSDGGGGSAAVILGLDWDSGSLECDACALICGADRRALDDQHFLFWNNPTSPGRSVFLRLQPDPAADAPRDRAQLLIDLAGLTTEAQVIVLSLSTLLEGGRLSSLARLRLRVVDPATGRELASYTVGDELTTESCIVIAEVYRHRGDWKLRAVAQGYSSGLVGLGHDYGVDLSA